MHGIGAVNMRQRGPTVLGTRAKDLRHRDGATDNTPGRNLQHRGPTTHGNPRPYDARQPTMRAQECVAPAPHQARQPGLGTGSNGARGIGGIGAPGDGRHRGQGAGSTDTGDARHRGPSNGHPISRCDLCGLTTQNQPEIPKGEWVY